MRAELAGAVGIYGGTFDPIHNAHLAAARYVRDHLQLQPVHLVVAADPPHRAPPWLNARQRLQLVRLAVADEPGLLADDCELQRPGPSYMVDTLADFHRRYPNHARVLVLGADALAGLHRWHRHEQLPRLCHLAVLRRPGEAVITSVSGFAAVDEADAPERFLQTEAGLITHLNNPLNPLSATALRQRLQAGDSIRDAVPASVQASLLQIPGRSANNPDKGFPGR